MTLETAVQSEIEALHEFFVRWFSGESLGSNEYFTAEFSQRFDESFRLIPPAGTMLDLNTLSGSIRRAYSSNPAFRIEIRNVNVVQRWENHILATYEEWQRNALASSPPDNGRIATVLFRLDNRLTWLHVHETWLPPAVMQAGPYNF